MGPLKCVHTHQAYNHKRLESGDEKCFPLSECFNSNLWPKKHWQKTNSTLANDDDDNDDDSGS